jgi:hypothetical protein
MVAASFLYPVAPRPFITGWDQLAVVLHVGSSLYILLLLDLAAGYLTRNSGDLGPADAVQSVWKWLALADKAGLNAGCIRSLARRPAYIDRASCKHFDKLEGLSPCVLKDLVVAFARDSRIPPTEGSKCMKQCYSCITTYEYSMSHDVPPPHKDHTLRWVCDQCEHPIKVAPVSMGWGADEGY